jgi:Fe-S cluster biosynthesis and repair protein YggX
MLIHNLLILQCIQIGNAKTSTFNVVATRLNSAPNMMKTVFKDHSTIAHMWANGLQKEARYAGGNFYFYDNTIYSYGSHFPIAKHVTDANGNLIVLFTELRYSDTTAKHINIVHSACSHLDLIYCQSPTSSHSDNFNHWRAEAKMIAQKLTNARKPEIHLNGLAEIQRRADRYARAFNLEIPSKLQELLLIVSKEQWREYVEKQTVLAVEKAKKEAIELNKKIKKDLKDFRDFKNTRMNSRNGLDFLRYNAEKQIVETSQGVKVPVEIAVNFYSWLMSVAQRGCTDCNKTILDFRVSEVNSKFFKVGCHTIEMKEAKAVYSQITNA